MSSPVEYGFRAFSFNLDLESGDSIVFLDIGVDKHLSELVFFSGPAPNANLSMLVPNEGNGFATLQRLGLYGYYLYDYTLVARL